MKHKRKKHQFNFVFTGSSLVALTVISFSLIYPSSFLNLLSWIKNLFIVNVSWFYVLIVFSLFCLCIYLALGPYRNLRLGRRSRPKYNNFTWLAMLFSAGMGTGLLFSGVYEPLHHYIFPPVGEGYTPEALKLSFQLTFLHWGFAGWAVYTFMGLAIAWFSFTKGLPLRVSSLLHPLLKKKLRNPVGAFIDILAVTVTLFGVAATLGRGTLQINSSLKELLNVPFSQEVQALIIITVTLITTLSVVSGLNRGIRRLSELNIILCFLLLFFVLFSGPTVFLLNSFVEYSGAYLQNLIRGMTQVESLGAVEWRSKWTILYWAWWIAWAPFMGIFIARISEGRTMGQVVLGALAVPTVLSCFWFTVFGGTAILYETINTVNLAPLLKTEYSLLTFQFLESFPFSKILSFIALFSVTMFFITSSDSASYVIHRISSKPSRSGTWNKIYWSFLEGFLALMIVFSGGMDSLELLVIIITFPFAILMGWIAFGFLKDLRISNN